MVLDREAAARKAEASNTNTPGYCQLWTREIFGAPSAGDRDRDKDADAVDGWLSEPLAHRHEGDRNPPRGVPVAFNGGSKGYGHRAISLGAGRIRSTDMTSSGYKAGNVGTTTIHQIERSMGVRYLGWSETITGIMIPGGPQEKEHDMPQRLAVYKMLERAGVETYLRTEWGTRYEDEYIKRRGTHPMPPAPADYHYLHITVTSDTDTVKEGFAGARQVESYGLSTPPMVSYQDLVTNEARVYQGQAYGTKGTHTVNDKNIAGFPEDLNLRGYAAAIMQNVGDEVTDEQVRVLAMIFAARELTGWVKKGAKIFPHRTFANKSCPGDKAVARLPEIEKLKSQFVKAGKLPDLVEEAEPKTRGEAVDAAIRRLKQAKGAPDRKAKIDRALKILKRIEFLDNNKS